ncbi:MAG: response regulator [Pseudomonadota bacterium]
MKKQDISILVIDDEQRVRQACRRVLEPEGYRISEAANGQEGLASIQQDPPDLVLVDLMMPVVDGMELLAAARQDHPYLAVVVITGYATMERAVQALQQGADDFLPKPFKPQDLRLVVERVLKRVRTLSLMAIEKSRTRVLVESMTNGVMVLEAGGHVAYANPALLGLLGCKAADCQGLEVEKALPCPEVTAALRQVLTMPEPQPHMLNCQLQPVPRQEPRYLQVRCSPFLDGRGHLVGALAVFDDITAWRRLDELKSEFVSTVAHEIASPLASVLGQLQNLSQGLAGPLSPQQSELVDRSRSRLEGIVALSRDLLDLSRIEAGANGQPEAVQVEPLLREALDMLGPQASQKGQSLDYSQDGPLEPVLGVARELGEVFINLLSNAIKYTPEGGRIRVWARQEGAELQVGFEDSGYGIAQEDQEKIFLRFFRVKDPNTRHIVGTGLGLPIVKRVVEEHGGQVRVQSQPGQGSTFIVSLPVRGPGDNRA